MKNKICVVSDFSNSPGARYRTDGPWSGEQFRDELLEPAFVACRDAGKKLTVDLDGAAGYATSFLEEAFGGLARKYESKSILEVLVVRSDDEPYLLEDVENYILHARDA